MNKKSTPKNGNPESNNPEQSNENRIVYGSYTVKQRRSMMARCRFIKKAKDAAKIVTFDVEATAYLTKLQLIKKEIKAEFATAEAARKVQITKITPFINSDLETLNKSISEINEKISEKTREYLEGFDIDSKEKHTPKSQKDDDELDSKSEEQISLDENDSPAEEE